MDIATDGMLAVLALGFLLGLKHATDADHVVAVTTVVTEQRNIWRGLWIGASWGAGHSTPLLVLGLIILAFQGIVLSRYEAVAPYLEFGVGIMLVYLGAVVVWNLRRSRLHVHRHTHGGDPQHMHVHGSHEAQVEHGEEIERRNGFFSLGKPVFRFRSYLIGVIHGLAGSAAVMLVLLLAIDSFWVGVGYLLLFSVGTIISMGAVTVLLAVPFVATGGNAALSKVVSVVAGVVSIAFGVALMSEIALGVSIIPF